MSHLTGTMREENGRGVVRIEDYFETTPADLWEAVTKPERLARWIATVSGDLRVGGDFRASFSSEWEGPGRVLECEPERRLLVSMEPDSDEGTVIEAILTAEEGGTRLVIEERGLPLDTYPGHGAGWQAHVEDLRAYLSGREVGPWRDRWAQLHPEYLERVNKSG